MCRRAKEFSLSSFILDPRQDFILFRTENERSAEQFETAVHKYIRRAISMLGNVSWRFCSLMNFIIDKGLSLTPPLFRRPEKCMHSFKNDFSRSLSCFSARSIIVSTEDDDRLLKTENLSEITS